MSLQHKAAALEGDWLLLCGEVQQISSINRALDKALSLGVAQLKQQADTTGGPQLELADAMVYIVLAAASHMSLLPHCVSAASLCLCDLTVSLQIRWPCSTLWRVQQGLESSLPTPTSGSWNSLHSARPSFGALHFRSRSGELTGLGCCGILAGNCSGARYAVRSSTRERVSVRECECMREREMTCCDKSLCLMHLSF